MDVREAERRDAEAMSDVLEELVAAGKRSKSGDPAHVLSHYLEHPYRLHCFVAVDDEGRLLGFQSLKRAHDGNPYGTPPGCGIIGTHVRPSAARAGAGSRLFAATLRAAREAGLPAIDAFIGERNGAALAYYESLGFRTYRRSKGVVHKALQLTADPGA